ncbi:GNAT family N-acetyltransferase [Brevibacillus massiliensis]|jgi:predicted GNAT family N-acyltransferase|uniref:GNAT family N-acetyltransferase n=1 Tax=Brevibacillus massiliensis TaxID=1118054 RepID=UPI0003121896
MDKLFDIRVVRSAQEKQDALKVRRIVFIDEQQVPEDLEIDEHDEDSADTLHFVAYREGQPVAAGRLRSYGEGTGKVERIAVLKSERGTGMGRQIMLAIEEAAARQGFKSLKLNSQCHAQPFYEKLGYEPFGDVFEDAGIPHIAMKKQL